MIGCILIAAGTLIVAMKGTLSRTGLPEETFALAMAVGVAIIFAGYLETRRPDTAVIERAVDSAPVTAQGVDVSGPDSIEAGGSAVRGDPADPTGRPSRRRQ